MCVCVYAEVYGIFIEIMFCMRNTHTGQNMIVSTDIQFRFFFLYIHKI